MSPQRSRGLLLRLLAVSAGCLTALFAAEAVLWLAFPRPNPYRGAANEVSWNVYVRELLEPGQSLFQPDPAVLPGTRTPSRFTINSLGFRSPRLNAIRKETGETRIFCLGGSTTECIYLDDDDQWPELIQKELSPQLPAGQSIDVVNAGVSGFTTREHLNTLTQKIVPLQPDIVIILAGVNDLGMQLLIKDYDILRRDSRSRKVHQCPELGSLSLLARVGVCDVSQIARRTVEFIRSRRTVDEQGNPRYDTQGHWIQRARERGAQLPFGTLPSTLPTDEFEQNLRSLVGICQAHRAIPVLMTQSTLMRASLPESEQWLCNDCIVDDKRMRPAEYRLLLDQFNSVTQRVAADTGSLLVDLDRELSGDLQYYYDSGHYNCHGSVRVADLVVEKLAASELIRPRLPLE